MTTTEVKNIEGKKLEDIELPETLFQVTGSSGVIHDVIRVQQSRRRRGTASTKTRAEVSASGSKPWRQKGTGRARSGSRANPIWRSGGVIFGPRPRSFAITVPRKVKRKALKSILAIRFQKGRVTVIDQIAIDPPSTKELAGILKTLEIEGTTLIITPRLDRSLHLSARNIPGVTVAGIRDLNTYLVVSHRNIIITKEALGHLQAWMEKIK